LWKAIALWKYPHQAQAYSNGTQNGWKELVRELSETVVIEQILFSQWTKKLGLEEQPTTKTERDTYNLPEIRVVVMGFGADGCTSLIFSFLHNGVLNECDPTIEDTYTVIARLRNIRFRLDILDTAGQEEYSALRDQWCRTGEAFLILCEITSKHSFTRLNVLYEQICRAKDEERPLVVLVGSKKDLEELRVNPRERYIRWAQEKNVFFIETSITTREGVCEAFTEVVRLVLNKRELLSRKENDKKKKCICS
jgi:small GTP-binding protein